MSGGESPARVKRQVLMALCTLTLFSSQLDGSSILPFKSYMYVCPGPLEVASSIVILKVSSGIGMDGWMDLFSLQIVPNVADICI